VVQVAQSGWSVPGDYADNVSPVDLTYDWISRVLFWGEAALWIWAVGDCLIRKAAAFPAVDKLSKAAWLGITGVSLALGLLASEFWDGVPNPIGIIALLATLGCSIYLADVRPAVREVSGGKNW